MYAVSISRGAAEYRSSRRWISSISLWSKVFRAQTFLPAQLFKFLVSDMAGAAAHDGIDDLADTLLARVVVQHLRQHRYFQNIVPGVDFPVAVPVYAGM